MIGAYVFRDLRSELLLLLKISLIMSDDSSSIQYCILCIHSPLLHWTIRCLPSVFVQNKLNIAPNILIKMETREKNCLSFKKDFSFWFCGFSENMNNIGRMVIFSRLGFRVKYFWFTVFKKDIQIWRNLNFWIVVS